MTTTTDCKFYDHAANFTNPNVGHAVARVRKDCMANGTAYTVKVNTKSGEAFYWNGGYYDCVGLAKQMLFSGAEVVLVRPDGAEITDIPAACY